MYKSEKKRCYIGIAFSVVVFVIGQFLLNYVSEMEKPAGGHTLYIISGTALILFSVISIFFLVKHILHLKKKAKKKRRTHIKFLDKNDYKSHSSSRSSKKSSQKPGNSASSDLINS